MRHDDFDPIARRRAKRAAQQRMNLIAAACVAGGLGLCTGLFLVVATLARHNGRAGAGVSLPIVSSITGPLPTSEGITWNHQELLAYLRGQGLDLAILPTHMGGFAGPAALLYKSGGRQPDNEHFFLSDVVYVQKQKSAQDAKDYAGINPNEAFSWGRFYFRTTNPVYGPKIKKLLGVN